MTPEQYNALVAKLGQEAADALKKHADEISKSLNEKYDAMIKGMVSADEFSKFKGELMQTELKQLNDQLKKLEDAAKTQGTVLAELRENSKGGKVKTLAEFLKDNVDKLTQFRKAGTGFIEISGKQLKEAGVTSVAGSVQAMTSPPGSPYLPGLAGTALEVFDITRNPNFILNRVDVGSTDQFRLAWINETAYEGSPAEVAEEGSKPLTQHKFQVELSEAKKAAAYVELTEEFEKDIPGLATQVRRMLQQDVIRAFDDAVQAAVIAAARPYEITGLNSAVPDANNYDALGAMLAQIAKNNYVANTVALNPVTMWGIWMQKNAEGNYLIPPFMSLIDSKKVEATKVAENNALVGDLTQYKVDIYEDFYLKMGWINDNFIKNKFCIVGEIRYHRYISDNRKKAICYDALADVVSAITSGS